MAKSETSFAEEFSELEEIVAWFEQDEIDIDQALKKFERGMELSDKLKKQLETAKNRVETIKAKFDQDT